MYNVFMKIKVATDFQEISGYLKRDLNSLNHNPDLLKMLKNIEKMVEELSKMEVDARRKQKYTYTEPKVELINRAIDHLEKLILMAKLMQ